MLAPSLPKNEEKRLAALKQLNLLDSPAEEAFDDFTFLASNICGTPIALITLLDETRQWFKSKVGIDASETPREISFCGHAILSDDIFEVTDALSDVRFMGNPLVIGEPKIRFYAGIPIKTKEGFNLGTLCVIDTVPKKLTDTQRNALKSLARQVMAQIERQVALKTNQRLNQDLSDQSFFLKNLTDKVPALISYWDNNLICQFANEAYHQFYGKPVQSILGKHFNEVIGNEIYQNVAPYLEKALNGEKQVFDVSGMSIDGKLYHGIINYTPNIDMEGNVQGIYTLVQNVTDFKESEEKRLIAELVNENSNTGILITNKNHEITSINQAFLKMTGFNENELIGKTPDFLFDSHSIHEVMECLSSNKDWNGEGKYRKKTGGFAEHQGTVSILKNTSGEVTHHVATIKDPTESKKLQKELGITRKMLERTGKIANLGGWEYDFKEENVRWSDQIYIIRELDKKETPSHDYALSFFPEEARLVLKESFQKCIEHGISFDLELPLITAKGNHIWVRTMGEMVYENGEKSKIAGIFQDISLRKRQEQQALNKEIALRQTVVREVHHHIKNNIQGLSGILYNALNVYPELTIPINETIGQLESVTVIHGLQGKNIEADIEISELAQEIAQNIEKIWRTKFHFENPQPWVNCHLSKTEAVPIALILGEMMTNASKHALKETSITIALSQKPKTNDVYTVDVTVINTGEFSPPIAPNGSGNFGLELISSLMPKAGAYFSISSSEDQTHAKLSLSFPVIKPSK